MRRIVVAMALVLAGCGGGEGATSPTTTVLETTTTTAVVTHNVTGTFLLRQEGSTLGSVCAGTGGYDDIKATSQVTIKDQAGTLLAVTSLGPGTGVPGDKPGTVYCRWRFLLTSVPDRPFYQFETSRRGAVTYSKADMEGRSWNVALSLG